jgi:hypothetical protein
MQHNLNQPNTLIFHPGIGKTATSAIQSIGLSLPTDDVNASCFSPYGIVGNAHNALASNHPMFNEKTFATEWENTLNFVKQRNAATIISSEFLIRDKPIHIKKLIEDAQNSGINVKVIIGVRSYTNYLISAFLQAVKVNWGIPKNENIFKFCERELEQIRMNHLCDHWARHTGDQNIHLIDYDLNKEIFVELFFKSIGRDNIDIGTNKNVVNASIPLLSAQLIRQFDNVCSDPDERKSFISYVSKNINFNKNQEEKIKNRINNDIVKNTFSHDIEILSSRYNWVKSCQ